MQSQTPSTTRVHRVTVADEKRLVQVLSQAPDGNAYLLGLVKDYSVGELARMQWGWFHWYGPIDRIEGVLYLDTTGLAIVSPSTKEAILSFADFVVTEGMSLTRIICEAPAARSLDCALRERDSVWGSPFQMFEEDGMILRNADLATYSEPRLRLAEPNEACSIARGAASAMEEELNLKTEGEEMDRLIRSKIDLISRERYFVLSIRGRIVFQAFLSTILPQVALIQGVWVPRDLRNRGIATRCVAEICRRVLNQSDHLILRVQRRNLPAVAAYRKVGFRRFMDYLSIWYSGRHSTS